MSMLVWFLFISSSSINVFFFKTNLFFRLKICEITLFYNDFCRIFPSMLAFLQLMCMYIYVYASVSLEYDLIFSYNYELF